MPHLEFGLTFGLTPNTGFIRIMADGNGNVNGLNVIIWGIIRIVTGNTEHQLSGHRFRQLIMCNQVSARLNEQRHIHV